jgi:hypothetical protein
VRYVFELLIARLSERIVQIDWTAFVVEKVNTLALMIYTTTKIESSYNVCARARACVCVCV